jgi:hypothetical protein
MKQKQKRLSFDEMRERFQVKEYHRRKAEDARKARNDFALSLVKGVR